MTLIMMPQRNKPNKTGDNYNSNKLLLATTTVNHHPHRDNDTNERNSDSNADDASTDAHNVMTDPLARTTASCCSSRSTNSTASSSSSSRDGGGSSSSASSVCVAPSYSKKLSSLETNTKEDRQQKPRDNCDYEGEEAYMDEVSVICTRSNDDDDDELRSQVLQQTTQTSVGNDNDDGGIDENRVDEDEEEDGYSDEDHNVEEEERKVDKRTTKSKASDENSTGKQHRSSGCRDAATAPTTSVCPSSSSSSKSTPSSSSSTTAGQRRREFVRTIRREDVAVGNLLGSGSYSNVYLVYSVRGNKGTANNDDRVDHDASSSERKDGTLTLFAMKCLHDKTLDCAKRTKTAARDLAYEVFVLAKYGDHPNIIGLRGTSSDFWTNRAGRFLVLDRIVETLEERLARTRNQMLRDDARGDLDAASPPPPSPSLSIPFLFPIQSRSERRKKYIRREEQRRRIVEYGLPIASAMRYLHGNRVIYRDLKPANIGFDADGVLRIFDFGLARSCKEEDRAEFHRNLTRKRSRAHAAAAAKDRFSGSAGTMRYMSPEVHDPNRDYGFPADVYSFSMVLWEVVTCRPLFPEITQASQMRELVFEKGMRPSLTGKPQRLVSSAGAGTSSGAAVTQVPGVGVESRAMRQLLKTCWHPDERVRPTFDAIAEQLSRLRNDAEGS